MSVRHERRGVGGRTCRNARPLLAGGTGRAVWPPAGTRSRPAGIIDAQAVKAAAPDTWSASPATSCGSFWRRSDAPTTRRASSCFPRGGCGKTPVAPGKTTASEPEPAPVRVNPRLDTNPTPAAGKPATPTHDSSRLPRTRPHGRRLSDPSRGPSRGGQRREPGKGRATGHGRGAGSGNGRDQAPVTVKEGRRERRTRRRAPRTRPPPTPPRTPHRQPTRRTTAAHAHRARAANPDRHSTRTHDPHGARTRPGPSRVRPHPAHGADDHTRRAGDRRRTPGASRRRARTRRSQPRQTRPTNRSRLAATGPLIPHTAPATVPGAQPSQARAECEPRTRAIAALPLATGTTHGPVEVGGRRRPHPGRGHRRHTPGTSRERRWSRRSRPRQSRRTDRSGLRPPASTEVPTAPPGRVRNAADGGPGRGPAGRQGEAPRGRSCCSRARRWPTRRRRCTSPQR